MTDAPPIKTTTGRTSLASPEPIAAVVSGFGAVVLRVGGFTGEVLEVGFSTVVAKTLLLIL
jgi:hypothetical protein